VRLRGYEKRRKTVNERELRSLRMQRLTRLASEWAFYEPIDAEDFVSGEKAEAWQVLSWLAGWGPRPAIKPMMLLKILWPQCDIYAELLATSPFLGIIPRDDLGDDE